MSKIFKGTSNGYRVVGTGKGAEWGVNFSLLNGKSVVIRFACLGKTPTPPVHFNYRMSTDTFEDEGVAKFGLYFDRVTIPVVKEPVPLAVFKDFASQLDLEGILTDWTVTQFKKEGVEADAAEIGLEFNRMFEDIKTGDPALAFVMPKDIWHEPKTLSQPKPSQGDDSGFGDDEQN
jgi:hypothetical protein